MSNLNDDEIYENNFTKIDFKKLLLLKGLKVKDVSKRFNISSSSIYTYCYKNKFPKGFIAALRELEI